MKFVAVMLAQERLGRGRVFWLLAKLRVGTEPAKVSFVIQMMQFRFQLNLLNCPRGAS